MLLKYISKQYLYNYRLISCSNLTRAPLNLSVTQLKTRRFYQYRKSITDSKNIRAASKYTRPLVWIDLETTGTNKEGDHILEISCYLTTRDLNLIDDAGYNAVIQQPIEILSKMDFWPETHHRESGLTNECLNSQLTLTQADAELSIYINNLLFPGTEPVNRNLNLAGNTIWFDRTFIDRLMPKTSQLLGPRMIDVSALNEIGLRHNHNLMKQRPKKSQKHRAKDDILESIAELKWYMINYLREDTNTNCLR